MFKLILFFMFFAVSSFSTKVVFVLNPGGMLGYTETLFLKELEERLGNPIGDYADLLVGCSTGAVIAGLLSLKNENAERQYTSQDIVSLYETLGKQIFDPTKKIIIDCNQSQEPNNLENEQGVCTIFDRDNFENIVSTEFGDISLCDLDQQIALFTIKLEGRKNLAEVKALFQEFSASLSNNQDAREKGLVLQKFFFSKEGDKSQVFEVLMDCHEIIKKIAHSQNFSFHAIDNESSLLLKDAVVASSCSPLLFLPKIFTDDDVVTTLIDGDLDPFCTRNGAIDLCLQRFPGEDELVVIEFGPRADMGSQFLKSFDTVDFQSTKITYFALEPDFSEEMHHPGLSSCSKEAFEVMRRAVSAFIEKNPELLTLLVEKLQQQKN